MAFEELGLVIEQIHLARAAVHEELNDAFGFGRMMQFARQQAGNRRTQIRARSKQSLLREQVRQSDPAKSTATAPKEFAPRGERPVTGCSCAIHSFAFAEVWS